MAHPHSRFARTLCALVLTLPAGAMAQTTFQAYVSSGLSAPIGVVNAGDGSNRLFVIQQGGAARVISSAGTLLVAES